MNKSKTPRTDAMIWRRPACEFDGEIIAADFARTLEHELTRLRDRCARLKRQRDWLRIEAGYYEPTGRKGKK